MPLYVFIGANNIKIINYILAVTFCNYLCDRKCGYVTGYSQLQYPLIKHLCMIASDFYSLIILQQVYIYFNVKMDTSKFDLNLTKTVLEKEW